MSRGVIIAVAAVCGAGAFLWTLVARSPRREAVVVQRGSGPGDRRRMPGRMALTPPLDLAGLEHWVTDYPEDFHAWFNLAQRRRGAGKPEEERAAWVMAVNSATQATTREPVSALAWYDLGRASARLGNKEDARRALAEAERLYSYRAGTSGPGLPLVFSRLGWARRGLDDEAGAREAWEKGLSLLAQGDIRDLDPDSAYNLACFRSLLGNPVEALEALAVAVDKGYIDADWASHDDDLTPIAHEARFAELIAKMREGAERRKAGE